MLRKLLHLPLLTIVYLGLVGYNPLQESELTWNGPTGWTAFFIVLLVILVAAIFIVLQSRLTPDNAARYHLDHAAHPSDEHAGHAAEHVEPAQPSEE